MHFSDGIKDERVLSNAVDGGRDKWGESEEVEDGHEEEEVEEKVGNESEVEVNVEELKFSVEF
jgi:hypothetical protein